MSEIQKPRDWTELLHENTESLLQKDFSGHPTSSPTSRSNLSNDPSFSSPHTKPDKDWTELLHETTETLFDKEKTSTPTTGKEKKFEVKQKPERPGFEFMS
eukprot:PhF_6_TR32561/c0_g1_i1/m.48193